MSINMLKRSVGVFSQLLLLTVLSAGGLLHYQQYYCKENNETLYIEAEIGKTFILSSLGYPLSVHQECLVNIHVSGPAPSLMFAITVQYVHAFYNGSVFYAEHLQNGNNKAQRNSSSIFFYDRGVKSDAFAELYIYAASSLDILYAKPDNAEDRWSGFRAIVTASDSWNYRCPYSSNETVVLSDSLSLISDFIRSLADGHYCTWSFAAPSDEWTLAVEMVDYCIADMEELSVEGVVGGVLQSRKWTGCLPTDERVTYYDSPITVIYNRNYTTSGMFSPRFRLMITPMQRTNNKNCSLAYNNKTFTSSSGVFSNTQPYQTYRRNEECVWKVSVPPYMVMHIRFTWNDVGYLTGDLLTIKTPQNNISHFSPLFGYDERMIVDKSPETSEVIFTWETDGAYEYNGFALEYSISGNPAENILSGGFLVATSWSIILWIS